MRLEKQEACQLYIEQEIEEGLRKGQTPYHIGKELAVWIEKLFETKIPAETIKSRAYRQQVGLNEPSDSTPENDKEIGEKPDKPVIVRNDSGQFDKGTKIAGPGRPPKFKVEQPAHRTQFTGNNEWYTPVEYIEAARQIMGSIDLDPASSVFGQGRIEAGTYFTKENSGLDKPWFGNVWLNPPYSQPLITQFIEKTIDELQNIAQLILLTHSYTDTFWFHLAESKAQKLCFTRGRIRFESDNGKTATPTQGQCFFYFGENIGKFLEVFEKYGFIR